MLKKLKKYLSVIILIYIAGGLELVFLEIDTKLSWQYYVLWIPLLGMLYIVLGLIFEKYFHGFFSKSQIAVNFSKKSLFIRGFVAILLFCIFLFVLFCIKFYFNL
jgi:hypothetical protein